MFAMTKHHKKSRYYTHQGLNINHHLTSDKKKNKVGDPTSHYFHYMAFKKINWSFHKAIWLLGLTVFFGCLQCCTHKMIILQITPNFTKRRGKRRRKKKKQKNLNSEVIEVNVHTIKHATESFYIS